jgi:U3 small nucleolar RNA-associated protein 18
MHKATDEGSLTDISLCTSRDSSYFATGSSSGIVNVYKKDEFLGRKSKQLKTIENLTAEIGQMKFNHDAQILAISSRNERNWMRLVHAPSFTVFQNWPGPRFSLQYPRCLTAWTSARVALSDMLVEKFYCTSCTTIRMPRFRLVWRTQF